MRTALLIALTLFAAPAFAGTFIAPTGCAATLTVQSRGCSVSHFYTCEADPKGNQWRADFGPDGQYYQSMIDSETQWLESYEMEGTGNPVSKETLDPAPRDPASFSGLLESGVDTFDFNLTKDNGERTRVTGFDQLTGKSAVIDGVTLLQTEYQYTQTDDKGNVLRASKGREYISEDFRSFFSGTSFWEAEDGSTITIEGAPVTFIKPGEPGFESTEPLFECDAQQASL
jgi:hypothetical protein